MKTNKGGRPKKNLEGIVFNGWEQLDAMVVWATQEYCADQLGMNKDTLAIKIKEKTGLSFPEYKDKKMDGIRFNLLKKQYQVAMQGNVSMLIWLGKNLLGQTDKQENTSDVSHDGHVFIVQAPDVKNNI